MQQIRVELATLGRSIGHYFTVVYKLNTPVNWQKNAYQPRIITSEDLKRLGPFKTWSGRVTRTRVSLRGKNSVLKARQNSGCRKNSLPARKPAVAYSLLICFLSTGCWLKEEDGSKLPK